MDDPFRVPLCDPRFMKGNCNCSWKYNSCWWCANKSLTYYSTPPGGKRYRS